MTFHKIIHKITCHSTYDEIGRFWDRQNDAANIIQKSWREFVENRDACSPNNRCEDCSHCNQTRVCDMCECVGGCFDHCEYIISS